MIIPKSHRTRHKILQYLLEQRNEHQIRYNSIDNAKFTIDEISDAIGIHRKQIDEQLNVLWENKLVIDIPDNKYPNNPALTKYLILPSGMSLASSKSILNEGKILNSQLFNNYASGIFQIIIGVIAIWTIYQNVTTLNILRTENQNLQTEVTNLSKEIANIKANMNTHNVLTDKSLHQNNKSFK